jgi:hypothetical protein
MHGVACRFASCCLPIMDLSTGFTCRSSPHVVVVLVTLTAFAAAHSSPRADGQTLRHVRAIDPQFEALITEAARRSPLFRSLLDRLDQSSVVVYVGYGPLAGGLRGRLTLAGSANLWRYVRIEIECRQSRTNQMVALGHELQHAVEIADATTAVDQPSLQALYRRIGFPIDAGHHQFESDAAKDAGRRPARIVIAVAAQN